MGMWSVWFTDQLWISCRQVSTVTQDDWKSKSGSPNVLYPAQATRLHLRFAPGYNRHHLVVLATTIRQWQKH